MNNQQEAVGYISGDDVMDEETMLARQRVEMDRVHSEVAKMRDKWVQHRASSGIETRWRRANELYHGGQHEAQSQLEELLKNGPSPHKAGQALRSRVVVNIVQPKVEQAVARLSEILFPVDDRNWGIGPTPIPEIADALGDNRATINPETKEATGLTLHEEADYIMQAAKKSADAMQTSIDDSLTECRFNGESRKVIENGARLGTGVMYGPFPKMKATKRWDAIKGADGSTVRKLTIEEQLVPASESLDPWNVYFDPSCGNDHQRGAGFFIKRDVNRKELRKLRGQPGYDTNAINAVLMSPPRRTRATEGRVIQNVTIEDSYELWQYHGEIEPDQMRTLTMHQDEPLEDVAFGVLIMVNDKVIGAMESWVADKSLPVDVWTWRKADDSPFGFGLPDALEHQQGVINAAWRQVMDNARISMGGQIIMQKGSILPVNNSYEITPNKLWYAKDELVDVSKAFATFEFQSHLQELLAIAQAAMTFADSESNMPQLMGGEQGSAPETVGGTILLFNQANGVLRQRVKLYDDNLTRPHISRYYDWKMEYDQDESIKGDCDVDARGSSALIERDIQAQALLSLSNVTSNPRYAPLMNVREELTAILKAFKVNPEDLLKTEDEVQKEADAMAQQGPPADPRIEAAKIQADVKGKEIAERAEQRQVDVSIAQQDSQIKRETLAFQREREAADAQIASEHMHLDREVAIGKLLADGDMSAADREVKERLEILKLTDGREKFNAEAYMTQKFGHGVSDH